MKRKQTEVGFVAGRRVRNGILSGQPCGNRVFHLSIFGSICGRSLGRAGATARMKPESIPGDKFIQASGRLPVGLCPERTRRIAAGGK